MIKPFYRPGRIQQQFFDKLLIKSGLSKKQFISTVAEVLSRSEKSIYKKLSGASSLSFEETDLLSKYFRMSLDDLMDNENSGALHLLNNSNSYEDFIEGFELEFQHLASWPQLEIWYSAFELPCFYYFLFPKLSAFKLYFWGQRVWAMNPAPFEPEQFPFHLMARIESLGQAYLQMASHEFWHEWSLLSFYQQIEYFLKMGLFSNPIYALELCSELKSLWQHLQQMLFSGYKRDMFSKNKYKDVPLKVWLLENKNPDNLILAKSASKMAAYQSTLYPNFARCQNMEHCRKIDRALMLLQRESRNMSDPLQKELKAYIQKLNAKISFHENRIFELVSER